MTSAEDTGYNQDAIPAYAEVERNALENHVYELVKGWAEVHDRLQKKHHGGTPIEIREVELDGSYPDTAIRLRYYEEARDRESWSAFPIWKSEAFFDENGQQKATPERIAGDILMLARGG